MATDVFPYTGRLRAWIVDKVAMSVTEDTLLSA